MNLVKHIFLLVCSIYVISGVAKTENGKIICFYNSNAISRNGGGKFDVEDIDPNLCTHIVYVGLSLAVDGDIRVVDGWNSLPSGNDAFRRFNALRKKNPALKTMISLGSLDDNFGIYSSVMRHNHLRQNLVSKIVNFIREYKFDGFDLHWKSPVQNNQNSSNHSVNILQLLFELRTEFNKSKHILSLTVPGTSKLMRNLKNAPAVSAYCDIINVITYDLQENKFSYTTHNSPFLPSSMAIDRNSNNYARKCIENWIKAGGERSKLVMGLATFGKSFTLANPESHNVYSPAIGYGKIGPWSKDLGFIGYNEIMNLKEEGNWTVVWDSEQKVPYMYKDDQWITFDNERSLKIKVEYLISQNLSGVSILGLDTDDFKGSSGNKFPLVNSIKRVIHPRHDNRFCYVTDISLREDGIYNVQNIDPDLCTHILYAFVLVKEDGSLIYPENDIFENLNNLRVKNSDVKILISLSKCNNIHDHACTDAEDIFSNIVTNDERRNYMVANILRLLNENNLDGIDINWKYPTNKFESSEYDTNFEVFLEQLRQAFDENKYILTVTVGGPKNLYNVASLAEYCDYINLNWFPFEKINYGSNARSAVDAWTKSGIVASKLLLGIISYGVLYQEKTDILPAITLGFYRYNEIINLQSNNWTVEWNDEGDWPIMQRENLRLEYDDIRSAHTKTMYALSRGLGGIFLWSLDGDDFLGTSGVKYPLLKTVNKVFNPETEKVVCYYNSSATQYHELARFGIENIDPSLCSHLIYSYIDFDVTGKLLLSEAQNSDIAKFIDLRLISPKTKFLVSIGGSTMQSSIFSQVLESNMDNFVDNIIVFMNINTFNGVDISWFYPNMYGGNSYDKVNFIKLLKHLRKVLFQTDSILSVTVGVQRKIVDSGYDVQEISKYADIINLQCYDLQGHWLGITGNPSPLYVPKKYSTISNHIFSVNQSVENWINHGVDISKLVVIIGPNARTFRLSEPQENRMFDITDGPGEIGRVTQQEGLLSYYEVLERQNTSGWTTVWDDYQKVPYMFLNYEWIGYENPKSVEFKVKYVKSRNLGGIGMVRLDMDDFQGLHGEQYPLLKTISKHTGLSLQKIQSQQPEKHVVCYYSTWSVYRTRSKMEIEEIDPKLCTHLIYLYIGISNDGSVKLLDPANDLDVGRGGFTRFNRLRKTNPKIKTLLGVGGWNEPSTKFSHIASNDILRQNFIVTLVEFVTKYKFDGADIDWEFPGLLGGTAEDKDNFSKLITGLRIAFDRYGLILSSTVFGNPLYIKESYDVPILSKTLDFINILSFDMHEGWNNVSRHSAPLSDTELLSVNRCIETWLSYGADPSKLVLGISSMGKSYTLKDSTNYVVGSEAIYLGAPGPELSIAGSIGFNEIISLQKDDSWTVAWDNSSSVPYMFKADQWISYDNEESVSLKVKYAKSLNLGGVFISSLDTDDYRGVSGMKFPLLVTINKEFK